VGKYFPDDYRVFNTGDDECVFPHSLQLSISILKTRFNRLAQVIEARFSAGFWSALSAE